MKTFISLFICLIAGGLTIYFLNPISDNLSHIIDKDNEVTIKDSNEYAKDKSYGYVKLVNNYTPYSYQDILNIYYTAINNGWDDFTFYCPSEYSNCLNDVERISNDELTLTHLNNYVHPFNSFTNVKTIMSESGEVNLKIYHLYEEQEKQEIIKKVKEIIKNNITEDMSDYDKIKTIHDYIANSTKYDTKRNEENTSEYNSYTAYGPLFEGLATCNGYTDLMAIFLTEMGYDNFKIATTPNEISYSATGHIWNAVKVNNEWLHIDLTWDDPVSSDHKDYLFHTYFLVTTEAMHEADKQGTAIEEHNFNSKYYLEFN